MASPSWRPLLLVLALAACSPEPAQETPAPWAVADLLGGDAGGFARVTAPGPFDFPRDHGPHPDYRHEWWYLTGNLDGADGRRFGFQATFFRFGLVPPGTPTEDGSAWRGDGLYMAHVAVTDAAAGRLVARERFARPALGLAGSAADPLAVWVEDWRLDGTPGTTFPLRLAVADAGLALDLVLDPRKPVVAQGAGGTSRKGPEAGNATRYYAVTRLDARGTLRLGDGGAREVAGSAWLDREWGSSALAAGVVGWDWFALQLDDGRDLMLYRLRRADGTTDPFSAGSLVAVDGTLVRLGADDFAIAAIGQWRADDGVAYPSGWRLRVPAHGLDLAVTPVVADQELRLSVRYWEGAVDVAGSAGGRGYAELTGYAGTVRGGGAR